MTTLKQLAAVLKGLTYDDMKDFSEAIANPARDYVSDLAKDDRLSDLDFDYFASLMQEWADEILDEELTQAA